MERSKEIIASAAEAVPRWLREHRIEAAAVGIVGVSVATAYAVWRWQAGSKTKLRAKEGAAGRASARIGLNKYEAAFAEDFLDRDELPEDCGFECIGGLEEQVSAIEELVLLPLSRSDLFQHSKIASRPSGVLLYGPPGTGKTMLAKAIARSAHASFLPLNIAHLQSKWFGETPKYIDGLWSLARRCAPCVIFIDEIDGFLGTRRDLDQQHVTSMKTKFMQEWDGMAKPGAAGEAAWVLVVAATNKPWAVDPAVLRRMPRQICVGLPDAAGRASILRVMLRGERVEPGLDVGAVAELAEGYSGSDLKELVRTASLAPIREALAAERRAAAAARGATAGGSVGGASTAGPAGAAGAAAPPPRGMRLEDFFAALEAVRPNGDVARAYYYESLTAGQSWNGAAGAGAGHGGGGGGGRSSALSGGAGAMPVPPVGRAAAAAMAAGAASPQQAAAGGSPSSSSSAAGGGVRETSKAVLMFGPSAKANSLRFAEAIEQEARASALGSP